ncbi:hypothetical protein PN836_013870 [Ningiella sp. W23]|uniref:hypothetical protein n=1 Tax=Ningiella sp. W23 TaxID=3023715 RepID=UPI003757AA41
MTSSTWSLADNRIAAIYPNQKAVLNAKTIIEREIPQTNGAVKVIAPKSDTATVTTKVKSEKIAGNIMFLHFAYGSIGLAIGLLLGAILVNFGPQFTQLNPTFTYIAMLSPGLFIGLFLSGLLSLKPQKDAVNMGVANAAKNKQWALYLELADVENDKKEIVDVLEQTKPKKII